MKQKMDLDITNFLPKYPNIHKSDQELFNPYGEDFYEAIFHKKEFYEERLPEVEEFPDVVGTQMKHQKIISRLLSSRTPYDQLLLFHEPGTGKTCTSIGVIEQIRSEPTSFTGALIFARGEGLLNNFRNELIFKCTDGRYIPRPEGMEDASREELMTEYKKLTDLEKVHRTKKSIRDFYTLNTFETFAKNLKRKKDSDIIKDYSNKIIVIDEVHNLRLKEKKEGLDMYAQFFRLCHLAKNTKILLMSGTPMKDTPDEIASVMNLILPLDQQFPTGENFMDEFFTKEGGDIVKLKDNKIGELKRRFKGRVSYLKAMTSGIDKIFEGDEDVGTLRHFKVVEDYMSDFQSRGCNSTEETTVECGKLAEKDNLKNGGYDGAYQRDREEKGVYSFSRQAALFVFPDGSYGSAGFNKYMTKRESRDVRVKDDGKKAKVFTYAIGKELMKELKGETIEEKLEKLEKFSSKYAATIRELLDAYEAGKSSFVYLEFVMGSGAVLFAELLKLFGYSHAKTGGNLSDSLRYSIITNETATQREIKSIIETFNKDDNMNGAKISVIIGSRVIGEGFSLQNIQSENILTPHWNYAETDQAIARGYRLGSHRALLKAGFVPQVQIYQRVSRPAGDEPSIDLEMYEISEIKDMNIKPVEKVIMTSSFDCALNYNRNRRVDQDGERDCNYGDCDYECDGVPIVEITEGIASADLDYSTYQIYYASPKIKEIIDGIVDLFRERFRMSLMDLTEEFSNYTAFELITALRTMINESKVITNKYGFSSYLKEENNVFFLIDSLSDIGNYFSEYYTKMPNVSGEIAFTDIIDKMRQKSFPVVVKSICDSADRTLLSKLSIEIQELFLESAILAQRNGITTNLEVQQMILDNYTDYYQEITTGTWLSSLLYDNEGETLRCLEAESDTWENCDEKYIEMIGEIRNNVKTGLERDNPYGYYGIYEPETDKFWLRDVSSEEKIAATKKSAKTRGVMCATSWDGVVLSRFVIQDFKIEPPVEWEPRKPIPALWKLIRSGKWTKKLYTEEMKDTLSDEEIRRAAYWAKGKTRKDICDAIREFLDTKGFVVPKRKNEK